MDKSNIGVVVIGRNEGPMLPISLASLPSDVKSIYVDSGSTDGSIKVAESLGVSIHNLDPSTRFSAARARKEGAELLTGKYPSIKYIQFVDGDCELDKDWIKKAEEYLDNHNDAGIVCGMLEERSPNESIYNFLSSLQWKRPVGEIEACGGIFMIKKDIYQAVSGFNSNLLTQEERDLCQRVLQNGKKVISLEHLMAKHDSMLLSFGSWWNRAVWGGYGDAVQFRLKGDSLAFSDFYFIYNYLLWPFLVPSLGVIGLIGMLWTQYAILIICLSIIAYVYLFLKLVKYRLSSQDPIKTAIIYALFRMVRKFASGYGFCLFFLQSNKKKKAPDPHHA